MPRDPQRALWLQPWGDGGTDGGWREGYPVQESHGNIRQCCVFLHNKCPSMRQSHLKRAIRLSFSFAKRLRLYQRGHDEFSTDIHSVWALSEHAFKWSLSASASYYTRISKLSLLSSTTSNTITTAVLAPLHHPLPILPLSLSNFLLWHFSSWSTSPKTPFICSLWWTHLHFFSYITFRFVTALSQTAKSRKPSFLNTLFPVSSLLNQEVSGSALVIRASKLPVSPEAGASFSRWNSCYVTCFFHDHCCLRQQQITDLINTKNCTYTRICPFKSSNSLEADQSIMNCLFTLNNHEDN